MDVVVQHCIEWKTNDLEYIYSKCLINNTIYRKGHRQTVYLINRMASEWYKDGYIIGNNVNKWNEKPDKYAGALVLNPTHVSDYPKRKIDGRSILIVDNLFDFDYSALYPSITLENNIASNTQIGKVVINDKVYDNENCYNDEHYTRGGEFIENLVTDNSISFCHRWLHLANFKEMLEDIDEYYGLDLGKYRELVLNNSPILPMKNLDTIMDYSPNDKPQKAISFINDSKHPEGLDYNTLLIREE
jgi:hypothetical protein